MEGSSEELSNGIKTSQLCQTTDVFMGKLFLDKG